MQIICFFLFFLFFLSDLFKPFLSEVLGEKKVNLKISDTKHSKYQA